MEITNIEVSGMEAALRGMRNPLNSWAKSTPEADVELGRKLASAGAAHGKFLRMITITCDITAPLYWWKEFDTYKVGTVANSCSTMHTLTDRELELDDFETEDFDTESCGLKWVIDTLNDLIAEFKANPKNNTESWRALIAMLPSCYLQKRTVMLNYEVLRRIVKDRTGHKLKEWKYFIEAMSALPYYTEFILGKTGEECMKESVEKSFISVKECLKDNANTFKEVSNTNPIKWDTKLAASVKGLAVDAEKAAVETSHASLDDILKATEKAAEELRKNIITDKNSKPKAPCCVDISGDTIKFENDPINPSHYKDHCSIECIEAMEIAFGEWETAYFCLGNAFKYLWRHKYKTGQEDLKKAIWYLDKAEELGGDEEKINDLRKTVEKYKEEEK